MYLRPYVYSFCQIFQALRLFPVLCLFWRLEYLGNIHKGRLLLFQFLYPTYLPLSPIFTKYPYLKVRKFRKQFFLKLHCPKCDRNFLKNFCPKKGQIKMIKNKGTLLYQMPPKLVFMLFNARCELRLFFGSHARTSHVQI